MRELATSFHVNYELLPVTTPEKIGQGTLHLLSMTK